MSLCHYSIYGLHTASALELPELAPIPPRAAVDVLISAGAITGGQHEEPGLVPHEDGLLLVIPDVARFLISGGTHITVEANQRAAERNVRLYLLGSAFGALLHQRGLLPLHATAIEIDGKAILFMGASGEGKSTLAASFNKRGYEVLSDDLCVVSFDSARRPQLVGGIPRIRLWRDALEALGQAPHDYELSYVDDSTYEKYDVPVKTYARPVGLRLMYVLESGATLALKQLSGVSAADCLFHHTYRGAFVPFTGSAAAHWDAVVRLVHHVPLFAIERKRDLTEMNRVVSVIIEHAQSFLRNPPTGDLRN